MVKIKRRGAVYGIIGLMLCVAVYLNWSYVKTPDDLVVAGQVDEELGAAEDAAAVQQQCPDALVIGRMIERTGDMPGVIIK